MQSAILTGNDAAPMTTNLTRAYLERLSKEQLVLLCLELCDTATSKIEMFNGYKTQLKNIAEYLNTKNVVVDLASEGPEAERAKFIITKADEILTKLVNMENAIVPAILDDKNFVIDGRKGGVQRYSE